MVAGLKKADAERLAQFMDTACDLMNPTQVWTALKDCLELSAANKAGLCYIGSKSPG